MVTACFATGFSATGALRNVTLHGGPENTQKQKGDNRDSDLFLAVSIATHAQGPRGEACLLYTIALLREYSKNCQWTTWTVLQSQEIPSAERFGCYHGANRTHTVKYPMGTLTHLRLYIWDAPGAGPNWLKRTWRMAVFAAYDESDNDEREAHYNHSTMKLIDTPKLALK